MSELLEQGIDALKNGDKLEAYRLLKQVTDENPDDAKAWYYLAAAAQSRSERRNALSRVVEIMPENDKAVEALAKLDAEDAETDTIIDEAVDATKEKRSANRVVDASDATANRKAGAATGGAGFALPVEIPGAPERVDPQVAVGDFREMFMTGIAVLRGDVGAYHAEMRRASWWRFWLLVIVGGVITAILTTFSGLLFASQVAGMAESFAGLSGVDVRIASPSFLNILGSLILTAPLGIAAMYGGLYASNWWLTTQQNGSGALFEHAYAIALPVTVAGILSNLVGLLGAILPFIGILTGLASLAISIVGWWRAVQGIAHVHNVPVQWTAAISLVVFIIGQVIVAFLLGIIFSPFLIATSAVSFF